MRVVPRRRNLLPQHQPRPVRIRPRKLRASRLPAQRLRQDRVLADQVLGEGAAVLAEVEEGELRIRIVVRAPAHEPRADLSHLVQQSTNVRARRLEPKSSRIRRA